LEKLDLSGLENLTTLVIKNSNHLTQLQIPVLSKVKNITIEDNHKLKDIQFHETFYQSNLSSEWITKPSTWVSKLQGIFPDRLTFVIKNNGGYLRKRWRTRFQARHEDKKG